MDTDQKKNKKTSSCFYKNIIGSRLGGKSVTIRVNLWLIRVLGVGIEQIKIILGCRVGKSVIIRANPWLITGDRRS
jgi:hypothetical protein